TEGPFQSPQVSPNSEKPCNAKSDCKVFCEVHVFDTTQCHASRLSLEKLFFKRKISEYTGSNERPLSSITFSAYPAASSRSSWFLVLFRPYPHLVKYTYDNSP